MKKQIMIASAFAMTLALGAASCSNDDETPSKQEQPATPENPENPEDSPSTTPEDDLVSELKCTVAELASNFLTLKKGEPVNVTISDVADDNIAKLGEILKSISETKNSQTSDSDEYIINLIIELANNNLAKIPAGIFNGCSALRSITIPECVTLIKSGAFLNCANLIDVILGDATIIEKDAFNGSQYHPKKELVPGNVWFQKNTSIMTGRAEAFSCTVGDKTYLYGGKNATSYYNDMWVYDKELDAWKQLGTFSENANQRYHAHYRGTERRANGAMFSYTFKNTRGEDETLLYILGGEAPATPEMPSTGATSEVPLTRTVAYYNVVSNTFCERSEHPHGNTQLQQFKNGQYVFEYVNDTVWDENGTRENWQGKKYSAVNQTPIKQMYSAGRGYVEDLPQPICGHVAFTVSTTSGDYCYVGLGKTDIGQISPTLYVYNVAYDLYDQSQPDQSAKTWSYWGSWHEGLYQAVAQSCDDKVIIGSGETSSKSLSTSFCYLKKTNDGLESKVTTLPIVSQDFEPRANAASFYIKYNNKEEGKEYSRFYVGTGRNVLSSSADYRQSYTLLKDFWCFDFGTQQWTRVADCSNIGREGAIGFSTKRTDDIYYDIYGKDVRGFISFGFGSADGENPSYRNDNWEYLP